MKKNFDSKFCDTSTEYCVEVTGIQYLWGKNQLRRNSASNSIYPTATPSIIFYQFLDLLTNCRKYFTIENTLTKADFYRWHEYSRRTKSWNFIHKKSGETTITTKMAKKTNKKCPVKKLLSEEITKWRKELVSQTFQLNFIQACNISLFSCKHEISMSTTGCYLRMRYERLPSIK